MWKSQLKVPASVYKTCEDEGIKIGNFEKYLDDETGEVKSVDICLFQIKVSSRTSVLDEFGEDDPQFTK